MIQSAKQHILIVDDSEDDALLLSLELRAALTNPEFHRVDTEETMVQALASERWDLIISDHTMPKLDSRRALELVKKADKDIPFIIVSGTMPDHDGVTAMLAGANDYVDKGNRARLVPAVRRELRNATLRRSKEDAERSLIELTYYDPLTRLPNRQLLARLINTSLARKEDGGLAALVFIDLDRFMRINESFGYATGDQLLQRLAERLRFRFDASCILARMGEDKFAVFVESATTIDHVSGIVARINTELSSPFVIEGEEFYMTCSIGVSLHPDHGDDANSLIKHAESAKSAATRQGPGNVRFYKREAHARLGNPLRIENSLRHAVEHNELFLLFQPCLDLKRGNVNSCEALLRWRHPKLGIIAPDAFIPIADETGLIIEIGRWVLGEACRQAREWHDDNLDLSVAINVSAAQFRKPGFADDVARIVDQTGINPHYLELEITESVLMQDAETTVGTLRTLKEMGIRIAIDDFGTGYSSLSYLKRFPIDSLKIDKSFVRDLTTDPDNKAIVGTIIGLAQSLKLKVIAEGVETAEQLDYLRGLRCDRMQGFLIGRPVEPAVMAALAIRQRPLSPGNLLSSAYVVQ